MKTLFIITLSLVLTGCTALKNQFGPGARGDCWNYVYNDGVSKKWAFQTEFVVSDEFTPEQFKSFQRAWLKWVEVIDAPIILAPTAPSFIYESEWRIAGVHYNGKSEVLFKSREGDTLGEAFVNFRVEDGTIFEADIVLSDTLRTARPDIFHNAVMHELGHAFGLGHVPLDSGPGQIMNPQLHYGAMGSELSDGEVLGMQDLYGK